MLLFIFIVYMIYKLQFIGEEARKTRLGNFLKKVPQAPQKLPEKIGKNSHIAFFKWVNRLLISFSRKVFAELFAEKARRRRHASPSR